MRIFILFLFCFLASIAEAQSIDHEKVNALHKQKFDWLIKGNIDSLQSLLADKVNYIHSNGWIQNREEVIDDLKNGKLQYKSVIVEQSEVNLQGATALVTGRGTFSGVMNGTEFSAKLLYTEVYVKLSGRWKLTGRHACKLP